MKRLVLIAAFCWLLSTQACEDIETGKAEGINKSGNSELSSKIIDYQKFYCDDTSADARRLYTKGEQLDVRGNLDGAKEAYISAINIAPEFCDAMDNLGLIYRREGNTSTAIEYYLRSLSIAPTNTIAIGNLAVAYEAQGKLEKARTMYEKLIIVDENNPEGYYGLGRLQFDMEQYEDAIKDLYKAAEIYHNLKSPHIVDAYALLGFSLYKLNNCSAAVDYFSRSYSAYSDNAEINYYLGICLYSSQISQTKMSSKPYLKKASELGVQLPDEILEFIYQ